jgi:general secretion pathway protein J
VSSRPRGQAGFTLVEVMIALMVFSMIAVAGVGVLAFSVRAGAAGGARLDQAAALQRTVSIMGADLAQAVNRQTRDQAGNVRPAFTGEVVGMQLVRGGWSNLDDVGRPTLQKLGYQLVDGSLQRIAFPQLDGAEPLAPAVLMTGLKSLSLRYRFSGAWSERWEGRLDQPLPDAAELSLVRRDGVAFRALMPVGTGYRPNGIVVDAP